MYERIVGYSKREHEFRAVLAPFDLPSSAKTPKRLKNTFTSLNLYIVISIFMVYFYTN
jgi:hypothetical protein